METLNSGFEFLLRTWTEFCDVSELKGLHGFEVRVTVKIRARDWVRCGGLRKGGSRH